MPLGTEVGLGPDHIVLDGDTAAPKRAQLPPMTDSRRELRYYVPSLFTIPRHENDVLRLIEAI